MWHQTTTMKSLSFTWKANNVFHKVLISISNFYLYLPTRMTTDQKKDFDIWNKIDHPQWVRNIVPQALTTITSKTTLNGRKRRRGILPTCLPFLISRKSFPVFPRRFYFLSHWPEQGHMAIPTNHSKEEQDYMIGLNQQWFIPWMEPPLLWAYCCLIPNFLF